MSDTLKMSQAIVSQFPKGLTAKQKHHSQLIADIAALLWEDKPRFKRVLEKHLIELMKTLPTNNSNEKS
jgi:hypothetical protein